MFLKFSRNTRRTLMAACVMSVIALSSCSDDETTPTDEGDPKVTLKSSAASTVVWNTVTLTVEATDDQEIAQIELKIDGTSVKTATTSPFDFAWDTQKVAEGDHTITAIGTDKSGKSASVELKVTVRNILLKTTVPANFLDEGRRGFLFLSDKAGKVIASTEFENGDPIEFLAPASFNESTFSVTQALYRTERSDADIITLANVSRTNEWAFFPYFKNDDYPKPVGTATFNMTNAKDGAVYRLGTNSNSGLGDFVKGQSNPVLSLISSPGVLYVYNETDNKFGFFSDIKVGETKTINLNQVDKALTQQTLHTPSGFDYSEVTLSGVPTATTRGKDYLHLLGEEFDTEYTVSYPANAFPASFFVATFWADDKYAHNETTTGFDMVPLSVTADVTLKDNKFSGTITSADADYVAYYLNGEEAYNYDWSLIGPTGTQSIVIPELPADLDALLDPLNATGSPYGVSLADYKVITGGYEGFIQYMKTHPNELQDLFFSEFGEYKYFELDLAPANSGGRKSTNRRHGFRK